MKTQDRRMSKPDMGSIIHLKNQWNILDIGNSYKNIGVSDELVEKFGVSNETLIGVSYENGSPMKIGLRWWSNDDDNFFADSKISALFYVFFFSFIYCFTECPKGRVRTVLFDIYDRQA